MHYIFSAIVLFFLSPFNWILVLIIAGYFFRKSASRKICRITALCIFLVFSNQWLLDWYAKHWQPSPVVIKKDVTYSCGIVLGGFASPDAEGDGYFNQTADRFIQTEKLYKTGVIKHILISGGNGKINDKDFREAAWVKKELIVMGIPDSIIFIEDRSNNTSDNALYAKRMFDSLNLEPPYLLITSAQHVPRALLLFKNAGMPVAGFPCSYIAGKGGFSFLSLLPQPSALLTWDVYIKETVAYVWYKLT